MVTLGDLLNGNALILNSFEFYHFTQENPFWNALYHIEKVYDDIDPRTGIFTTHYVLTKRIKYLNLNTNHNLYRNRR